MISLIFKENIPGMSSNIIAVTSLEVPSSDVIAEFVLQDLISHLVATIIVYIPNATV